MNVLQACSEKKLKILDNYAIGLSVQKNAFDMPTQSLFSMAMRKNKKRQFLFVSKLIGKHIHIKPQVMSITGGLLAELFAREVQGVCNYDAGLFADAISETATCAAASCGSTVDDSNLLGDAMRELESSSLPVDRHTLFIGFAETATGLAHAVFRPFCGDCSFVHTTRVPLADREPELRFTEEHSHATSHLCYFGPETDIKTTERIVLIDDEITTGKTTLNFIAALLKLSPAREFVVLSILDWRGSAQRQAYADFEEKFGITINCISLLSGGITVPPYTEINESNFTAYSPCTDKMPDVSSVCLEAGKKYYYSTGDKKRAYSAMTGRFGITAADNRDNLEVISAAAKECARRRKYDNTLCLGTGEFIYIPSMLACGMGEGCLFGSTTLSPIIASNRDGYPVKNDITYSGEAGCGDAGSLYHIYNILPRRCPEVFLFSEQDLGQDTKDEISAKLGSYGVKNLVFITLV